MRIKIISEGDGRRTKVMDADTGELVEGVTSISWILGGPDEFARAQLQFVAVPVEIVGDTEAK
jgi:hypothetical protein